MPVRLTESYLRSVIKEELKGMLSEMQQYTSLKDIANAIERSGNKDYANRMRQDGHYKDGQELVTLSPSSDNSNLVMSWAKGGQPYYSIPMDIARKAGLI